ncbi:unannotated protein [freshwater metagenome]|uniref:Unannotated protein n=1 Tax=freshwater metagenome TaxID=449393 RepID=A0A6J7U759_9ZZZZ
MRRNTTIAIVILMLVLMTASLLQLVVLAPR